MIATREASVPACRAAVSTLTAPVLYGSVQEATVVASTRLGCYLLLHDGTDVVPVLAHAALALPTAVRIGDPRVHNLPEAFPFGSTVLIGESTVVATRLTIEVVRSVRPARVRAVARGPAHTPLSERRVRALLGRGPGLTPEGDDELAGHLLVQAALGGPALDLTELLHRTTALSASLLRAAAQGYAVPVVVAYVDAALARERDAAQTLRPLVAAIGHSSGPALLRGIDAACPSPQQSPRERTVA